MKQKKENKIIKTYTLVPAQSGYELFCFEISEDGQVLKTYKIHDADLFAITFNKLKLQIRKDLGGI